MDANLKRLKNAIKMCASIHIPDGRPNVFLLSLPRSGSTWVAELVATQPGFKWCLEPFNLRKPVVRDLLGVTEWKHLHSGNAEEKIYRYLKRFAEHAVRDSRLKYPNPLGEFYRPITRRTIFKIIHACEEHANWLADRLNGRILLLLRHPIPVTLSRVRYPKLMALVGGAYMDNFSAAQAELARSIASRGDKLECGVLDWCLRNALFLRQARPDWVIATYEQLLLDPGPVVAAMASRLQLEEPDRMMARLTVPSGSIQLSGEDTREVLRDRRDERKTRWLVEKWRTSVSRDDENRAMAILSEFAIDTYSAGDALPAEKYWLK